MTHVQNPRDVELRDDVPYAVLGAGMLGGEEGTRPVYHRPDSWCARSGDHKVTATREFVLAQMQSEADWLDSGGIWRQFFCPNCLTRQKR